MNCSFNIRYKPRTTRAFTKSDLTVYDSAGNTALNALTVYGKSEVVDGAITSAGEGWAVVDLGTLEWTYKTGYPSLTPYFLTNDIKTDITKPEDWYTNINNRVCALYRRDKSWGDVFSYPNNDMHICVGKNGEIAISNFAYTDPAAFKNAMSGVLLCYQLADPTQGNCIAVKTDNGSGINGTMATFTTGTPLRGIPDTTVRDVMAWDGSAGTVTKNCGEVDLGTLNYTYISAQKRFYATDIASLIKHPATDSIKANCLTSIYQVVTLNELLYTTPYQNMVIAVGNTGFISIRNTTYTDPTDFKTAMSGVKLIYELATPTTEQLTTAENTSIAGLRTFEPQTHAQNNAGAEMTVDYTIRVPTI